uniref:Acyltransferase 3 domain-containing protein n=1 Tax=Thermosporothrix sp. COM3 TaxID=2490863 RepID=A0A455SJE5_9CHLR|nr:hypothetical protein KTC_17930 [Thermosporothrix sp. COM3]
MVNSGTIVQATFQHINVPFWTLAIEGQFYLLLPFIARGMHVLISLTCCIVRRRFIGAIIACIGIIVVGLLIRFAGKQFMQEEVTTSIGLQVIRALFFGVEGKFWEDFALGMLVSLCFAYAQHPEEGERFYRGLRRASPFLSVVAVVLLTFCALWNFRVSYPVATLQYMVPLVPFAPWLLSFIVSLGWSLLLLVLLFGNAPLRMAFEWRPLRALGTISYGVYLWHFPLLTIFKKYVFPHFGVTNTMLSYLLYWGFFALLIVPWSTLVYLLIERPFIRMKQRRRREDIGTQG